MILKNRKSYGLIFYSLSLSSFKYSGSAIVCLLVSLPYIQMYIQISVGMAMVAKKQHFNILPDWSGTKIATKRVTTYNPTKRTTPRSAIILLEVHLLFLVCFSSIINPFLLTNALELRTLSITLYLHLRKKKPRTLFIKMPGAFIRGGF